MLSLYTWSWEFLGREWARRGKVLHNYSPAPVMPSGVLPRELLRSTYFSHVVVKVALALAVSRAATACRRFITSAHRCL